MKLIAPAYSYPAVNTALWQGLLEAREHIGHVIINPGSGPGEVRDPIWVDQVAALAAHGVPMLGYLNLAYSGKPVDRLMAEATLWWRWYGILDLFLDCAPAGDVRRTGHVADVLRSRTRAGALVANAGTRTAGGVARHFDAVVEHEGPPPRVSRALAGSLGAAAQKGGASAPVSRSWIVHSATAADARRTIRLADELGVAEVWVTDLAGSNPYRDLPAYWSWLLDEVGRCGL
jgi:hypothetical protein